MYHVIYWISLLLFSHVKLFVTPWTAACQASLSFTISQSLLKLMSIESVMPSNHLFLCHPLLLLPSIFPNIRVFSNKSLFHQGANVFELQLQHQPFQWIFRTDFLYNWLVWSLCYPRDSQESSPASQFKSINSSVLGLLYSPSHIHMGFPGSSVGKESTYNVRDPSSIPGLGRSAGEWWATHSSVLGLLWWLSW